MKLEFRSKNAIVYDQLRKSIVNGHYKPGTRLVIDQLSAELGVSQIPVREAVRQLEADGFITFEPYTGATVTEINANLIFEIFALLESVEAIGSRAACSHMTEEQFAALAALVRKMDTSLEDPNAWSSQNKEFHLLIGEYSQLTLANLVLRNVFDHWDRLRLYYVRDVFGYRIQPAQQEHKMILEAFRARDPDLLEKLIREHNQNSLTSYIGYLRSIGELATVETRE